MNAGEKGKKKVRRGKAAIKRIFIGKLREEMGATH